MSNYLRPKIRGATIYFEVALISDQSDLLVREIDRLRRAVKITRSERPFEVLAWTVLPHRMHCVWRLPVGDSDYATRWRSIKSRFSKGLSPISLRASHVKRQERGVWQRRYWEHHIRDAEDLRQHLRLCWQSPVTAGLAQRPEDWPFSSLSVSRDKIKVSA